MVKNGQAFGSGDAPRSNRAIRFSPFLLAVALSPVLLQTSTPLSCKSGDTTLSEFAVSVDGQDQIDGFDREVRSYRISVPFGTDEALVHATSTDPTAQVWIDVVTEGERLRYLHGGFGGGDMVVPLPPGPSTVEVWIRAQKGASGFYEVDVEVAQRFPCTEQGILDAIAFGGGPHTFGCNGPTVVATQAEIVIDNDVILDGEGNLTIDGNGEHRVLHVAGALAELRRITIAGGSDVDCGGVLNEGSLTISNCALIGNVANSGGAIWNRGTLSIVDSTVSGNSAQSGGGIRNTGTLAMMNSIISENDATFNSGAIWNTATLTMMDSTVSGNTALNIGGIGNAGAGILEMTNCTVSGNAAELDYGGIYGGRLEIRESTVSGNSAGSTGGGIGNTWMLTLRNSTVSGNHAGSSAGGVWNSGTLTIANSTVSGNNAGGTGGAIWDRGGTIRIANSTVSQNMAQQEGSAIYMAREDSSIETGFTLIDGECAQSATVSPTWVSHGYNVESPGDTCGFNQSTDQVNVSAENLHRGPLQGNGGATMTHALLPGSVAIDRVPAPMCVDENGDPLATDQRGVARPQGAACDVGAFEWADCSGTACDDGNHCTADYCDPLNGSWCANSPLPDGTLCSGGVCSDGACDLCPSLTKVLVTPLLANVGDEINVSAVASAENPINYLWTATGGSFADPTSAITTYLCEEAGQQTLTVTVSDATGSCSDESDWMVTCVDP